MADLFDFSSPKARFSVFGNPIAHSLSPQVHHAFAAQFGIELEYSKSLIEPGGFDQSVAQFFASGGAGLNITVPFKQRAFQIATTLDSSAAQSGAANTLKPDSSGGIIAYNTDGRGLCTQLQDMEIAIENQRLLILGAGGSTRAILPALLAQRPAHCCVAARSLDKAAALLQALQCEQRVRLMRLSAAFMPPDCAPFDLVINATSASLSQEKLPLCAEVFAPSSCAIDLMYQAQPTVFMSQAQALGAAQVADGLAMLVAQAAHAFKIWHEVEPETASVIARLRAQLRGASHPHFTSA